MNYAINWGALTQAPDAGAELAQGLERGSRRAQEQVGQDALRTLATNPADVGAYANLMAVSPDQAYRFRTNQRAQAEYDRGERFRGALSDYMTRGTGAPTRNALSGLERPTPGSAGSMAGTPGVIDALGSPALGMTQPLGVPPVDALAPPAGPDVVVTARAPERRSRMPGGAGWDDVVRADPEKALAASRLMFGTQKQELEAWQTVSSAGMQMLGGVHDQDSWDRARNAAERLYDSYGVPFPDLPDEYDPETVHALQMQQLDIEDQVLAALREKRFEWQRQDDEIDNARADREAGDRALDRRERRGLTARGQSMASADRRRGQDMTDRRVRETARASGGGRGRGSRAPAAAGLPKISTRDAYNALPKGAEYIAPDGSHKVKG